MKTQNLIPAIALGLMISFSLPSIAQTGASFEKGALTFSAGIGVGTDYNKNYNSGFGTKAVVETGLWQAGPGTVSLGGQVGASFSSGGYYRDYKTSTFVVAARSAWHYGWNINGLDTYAGLSAGAGFNNYKYTANERVNESEVVPVFGGFVGASYFFTPTLGVNVEAGRDITSIQAGIIFKLK